MSHMINPILKGFHPDPCICAAHGRYYLVTSTFHWVPGVSLYVSDDLMTWTSLGGALSHLNLRGIPDSAGVWAPDLTFDGERFWLIYTVAKTISGIFKDVENYVVTATDIEGPWSAPVFINVSGFDPGMYHENGHHYVLNPQWDPRPFPGQHRFNGLILQEFSREKGLLGQARTVLSCDDVVRNLREGPHIMKHAGWYYLACAEGGTGPHHRIRMARSRDLWDLYEVCPEPLVCSWCAQTPLRKVGHGNLIEAPDGSWCVCHPTARYLPPRDGTAPVYDEHEQGLSPLGRETALQQIIWRDDWPRLADGTTVPSLSVEAPANTVIPPTCNPGDAGYRYETNFAPGLDMWREQWLAPRHVPTFSLTADGLVMRGGDSPSSLFDRQSLSRRVTSFVYHAETTLVFQPQHYNQTADLICEYDARAFLYMYVSYDEERAGRVIDVLTCDNANFTLPLGRDARIMVPDSAQNITLMLDVSYYDAHLLYSFDNGQLEAVRTHDGQPCVFDVSCMSGEHVSGAGYTGTMVGITCVDMFDKSASACFTHFVYGDKA